MDKNVVRKQYPSKVEDQGEGVVIARITTDMLDRDNDIIMVDGIEYDNFLSTNPVVLRNHDYRIESVIGIVKEIKKEENALIATVQFDLTDRLAQKIYDKYRLGFASGWSIGFIPREWDTNDAGGLTYTKIELIELSAVAVPANPQATTIEVRSIKEKEVVAYQDLPLDMERSWDAAAAKARVAKWASSDGSGDKDKIDWEKYRKAFCWYDEKNPNNFGAYKLPIADIVDGKLTAIWRGVTAAMAAILGARGGVDIPDADRRKVYDMLVKYYEKAERTPPEFKTYKSLVEIPMSLLDIDTPLKNFGHPKKMEGKIG